MKKLGIYTTLFALATSAALPTTSLAQTTSCPIAIVKDATKALQTSIPSFTAKVTSCTFVDLPPTYPDVYKLDIKTESGEVQVTVRADIPQSSNEERFAVGRSSYLNIPGSDSRQFLLFSHLDKSFQLLRQTDLALNWSSARGKWEHSEYEKSRGVENKIQYFTESSETGVSQSSSWLVNSSTLKITKVSIPSLGNLELTEEQNYTFDATGQESAGIGRVRNANGDVIEEWTGANRPTWDLPYRVTFARRVIGDTNGDGKVTLIDLNTARNNLGLIFLATPQDEVWSQDSKTCPHNRSISKGDVNGDGRVDSADVDLIRSRL